MSSNIPIILLIYRRPAEVARVLETIRAARPGQLIIVADGPRADRPGDAAAVAAARAAAEQVDWPCQTTRIYAEANMGLRNRVESGISAALELVERAIILEDDCVPTPSFFRFCAELLDRYADDERVMAISGNDFQNGRPARASYRFSRYPHCWGWATWRRAWQRYDGPMDDWPALRTSGWLEQYLGGRRPARFWRQIFDLAYAGKVDSWAYRWLYSTWRHNGLAVLPTRNLVSNIGFGPQGTHTTSYNALAALPTYEMTFPLRHPPQVALDTRADNYTQNTVYDPPLPLRLVRRVQRALRSQAS